MKLRTILLILTTLAVACSNPATSNQGSTPGYAKGVITAKGSVWVNGVEYQTGGSTVSVDGTTKGDADLKVGMTVELRASYDPATGQWKAQTVDYESDLKGLVTSVDQAGSTFTVLGTVVTVTPSTVFEGTTDLTTLAANSFVEVSGTTDASGKLIATRVEVKTVDTLKVVAVVTSAVTTTATGGSFSADVGGVVPFQVNYTGTLDTAIGQNSRVRILFAVAGIDLGNKTITTTADQIQLRRSEPLPHHGDRSEVEGLVASLGASGDPVTFVLGTQKVSASLAVLGTTTLATGDRVEVEGSVGSDGTLVATKVRKAVAEAQLHETTGTVASVDLTASTVTVTPASGPDKTFVVTSQTIFHGDAWFGASPLSKVTVGAKVEVRSFTDTSGATSREVALKIEAEDGNESHHNPPSVGKD